MMMLVIMMMMMMIIIIIFCTGVTLGHCCIGCILLFCVHMAVLCVHCCIVFTMHVLDLPCIYGLFYISVFVLVFT